MQHRWRCSDLQEQMKRKGRTLVEREALPVEPWWQHYTEGRKGSLDQASHSKVCFKGRAMLNRLTYISD